MILVYCFVIAFPSSTAGKASANRTKAADSPKVSFIIEQEPAWSKLQNGLEVMSISIHQESTSSQLILNPAKNLAKADLVIIRAMPDKYEFVLYMAAETGELLTLPECARKTNMLVAINAGMYLDDFSTHTGYMKNANHINNSRIVTKFGAFFLSGNLKPELPSTVLLELKELTPDASTMLNNYSIAIQNYRLISKNKKILWPDSKNKNSISALARDQRGNIMFIMSRYLLSSKKFAEILLALPIDCHLSMYLEGGSPAEMLLYIPGGDNMYTWHGRSAIGGIAPPVPNILGLRTKQ